MRAYDFFVTVLLAIVCPLVAIAQNVQCKDYYEIIKKLETNFDNGKGNLDECLRCIDALRACDPNSEDLSSKWTKKIFDAIKKQKQDSEIAKNDAIKAKKEAEKLRVDATKAQKVAEEAEKRAKDAKEVAEKSARANQNLAVIFQKLRTDPTLAIRMAEYNMINHPDNPAVISAFNEIISDTSNIFYRSFLVHEHNINNIELSPGKDLILTSSDDLTAKIWDLDGKLITILEGHIAQVTNAIFSPDGKFILTSSNDKTAKLWTVKGECVLTVASTKPLFSIAFSPDGKSFVTAGTEKNATVWNLEGRIKYVLAGHNTSISGVAFSPNGANIITISTDHSAKIWDAVTGNLLHTLNGHKNVVNSIDISNSSKLIVTSSVDGEAILWSMQGDLIASFKHKSRINCVNFSEDGKLILTAGDDKVIKVWGTDGNLQNIFNEHQSSVLYASFAFESRWIISASSDKTVKIWDVFLNRSIYTLKGHSKDVSKCLLVSNFEKVISISQDSTLKIWNLKRLLMSIYSDHDNIVNNAMFCKNDTYILTSSADSTIRIQPINALGENNGAKFNTSRVVFYASISPDGTTVAAACRKLGIIRCIDLTTDEINEFEISKKFPQDVYHVSFSPDSKKLIASIENNRAVVWNLISKSQITTLLGHTNLVCYSEFSHQGDKIVTASADSTARIWDNYGNPLKILSGHKDVVLCANFSPDDNYIVTASADNTAMLWTTSGELVSILEGHLDDVNTAVFSPDGRFILTSSTDYTAKIWDTNGHELVTYKGHHGDLTSATFSSNGYLIITASEDQTARVWLSSHVFFKEGVHYFEPEYLENENLVLEPIKR